MSFAFLRSLLAGPIPVDPTVDWPAADGTTPVVSLEARQIGPLKFGGTLEEARRFGRPDSCRFIQPDYLELVYGPAGFQMDFEKNLLVYAAFFIAPDEFQPPIKTLRHCAPRERGGARFSAWTTKEDFIRALGQPDSTDAADADDIIINYCRNGLMLEFELNKTGHLKRWNLFPEENTSP